MKTIGLIGGVTWVSTVHYYRRLNELVADSLGGLHSARVIVFSLDFAPVAEAQHRGDWNEIGDRLTAAARSLAAAGAEILLIGANTLHIVYDRIVAATGLTFVHIVDAVGCEAAERGLRRVGLLGTRFTMEEPFYRERLERGFGLEVLTPDRADRDEVHRIIYEELAHDRVLASSRAAVSAVIGRLADRGAEAVILGCTELPLLFPGVAEDRGLPLLDPLELHCRQAVRQAL